jgi:uncharacterized coiled-coil DUF342 family protein
MTIDSDPPSPIGNRLRSRTGGNRETHEASDTRFRDGFRRDAKPQPPPHHGRLSQDGSFTFHRHDAEPQSPRDAAPSARNIDTSQTRDNFSQVMYTNRVLREENELLKRENKRLEEQVRTANRESRDLRQNVLNLQRDVDRKSFECSNLRAEVKDLVEKSNAPANQGTMWSFRFFQGTRSSHSSAENAIAELQRQADDYERKVRELVSENYQLQLKAADCEQKVEELVPENYQLQRKAADCQRKIKELEAENYTLQRKATDCEQKIAELGAENRTLGRKGADSERKIGELAAENSKLQRRDAERKEQMQVQTTRFADELEAVRNRGFTSIPNLSDTAVQQNWRKLCFAVRQSVSIHLPESLDLATIECLAGVEEFSWLPNMPKTLRAPLFCPMLLE